MQMFVHYPVIVVNDNCASAIKANPERNTRDHLVQTAETRVIYLGKSLVLQNSSTNCASALKKVPLTTPSPLHVYQWLPSLSRSCRR